MVGEEDGHEEHCRHEQNERPQLPEHQPVTPLRDRDERKERSLREEAIELPSTRPSSPPVLTTTPLPHATGVYGQLPRRDFNPLDLLLLLRTVRHD